MQLFDMVKNINSNCKVCRTSEKPKPVVSFPLARHFNEKVALDMKEWKSNMEVWFLHIIDHLTGYNASCVIKTKQKEETIKQVFRIWVSIFVSPTKFLVDNSGEINNEDFCSLCENVNICILTTAAESPWSNSLIERHNTIVGYTVTKTMEDDGCDLELTLSWAVAAKNSLTNVNGFSPNQFVFGGNQNFPAALNSKLRTLEKKSSIEVVANNINAMHTVRQAFIQSKSTDRIRHTLQYQNKISGDVCYFTRGIVYFKEKIIVSGMDQEQSLGRTVNKC